MVKYGIFDPDSGLYTFKDTYEDACVEIAAVGFAFYKNHCHKQTCVYVEVQDDGSEIWKNNEGVRIPSPDEVKKKMERLAKEFTRKYEDLPKVVL